MVENSLVEGGLLDHLGLVLLGQLIALLCDALSLHITWLGE